MGTRAASLTINCIVTQLNQPMARESPKKMKLRTSLMCCIDCPFQWYSSLLNRIISGKRQHMEYDEGNMITLLSDTSTSEDRMTPRYLKETRKELE
jgi:hypothetical protein